MTVYTPLVTLIADDGRGKTIDTELSQFNQELMDKLIVKLLSAKYEIDKKQTPQIDPKLIADLNTRIENSSKSLNGLRCDSLLMQIDSNAELKNRFALLMIYTGDYNLNFIPHHNFHASMASNSIVITPLTKPYSDLRLLILDTEMKEVVFFDKTTTSSHDPRVPSDVKKMTKTLLKKIYYK